MGRVFACSDLHGRYDLWEKIKEFRKPDDLIYFLGDAIDRGPDGIKLLKELLEDPQIYFLKGNHEDFLSIYYNKSYGNREGKFLSDWFADGGRPTYDTFIKLNQKEQEDLITKIDKLPVYTWYENKEKFLIHLSHAGFTPNCKDELYEEDLLWDRFHTIDNWKGKEMELIVHGHTPVPILNDYIYDERLFGIGEIGVYCGGHKVDIDLGAVNTGITVLFDLETFEAHYIK